MNKKGRVEVVHIILKRTVLEISHINIKYKLGKLKTFFYYWCNKSNNNNNNKSFTRKVLAWKLLYLSSY